MASVRKRSWNTGNKKKVAWVADYFDQTGVRRLKTFDTKKAADAFLTGARHDVALGIHTPDSVSITVSQACEIWLKTVSANDRERSTIRSYQHHIKLHILPLLGDQKLSRLTTPLIERFKVELLQTRSRAMARKVLGSLKMMIREVMRQGYIAQNVAAAVKLDGRGRDHERVRIPSKAEINAILAAAEGRWRPLLVVAIFTGLRASELRGLRWADVDFNHKTITVAQRADQWGIIGRPKSGAGRRTVPLPPTAVAALKEWRLACPHGEAGLVFPNGAGRVENHSNIANRGFDPIQIAAGVSEPTGEIDADGAQVMAAKYSFHALRHFYASWVIEQDFSPKRIQSLLGHSSIQMTYDTYGHLFPSLEDDHAKLAAAERALITA
ncbi:MAG TPA: site-specific integrase [Stellaceae bacterium]|nr:site-specific integrase [Stellaceae bacterium]